MTIAIDRQTGENLGQCTGEFVLDAEGKFVPTYQNLRGDYIRVFNVFGYSMLPASSVRVEKVS